ncbi:hypothetical protein PG2001B_1655 [Bifidobacterium pseudolongum subsp. globosum]|uniref:Uncharacterized protein n=1 Tax=Bifidobacterium pseudolongum subsp. globosum TaxID=1690 RepID=A0A4Q5ARR3_9BIFI|nr:hypothetical protein [Bifidobacterium pseudolongum]RYQ36665.1 hypothetical protein PG2001B_1655 [Bifidobacterium pseudolongum subsp. globosum]
MSSINRPYLVDMSTYQHQYLSASPVMQRDDRGRETETQRRSREGLPVWKVRLLETDLTTKAVDVQEVTIAVSVLPSLARLTTVRLVRPSVRAWAMPAANGVRSGVTLSAEGIEPAAAPDLEEIEL